MGFDHSEAVLAGHKNKIYKLIKIIYVVLSLNSYMAMTTS
jgi:hypothetical protein